MVAKEKRDEKIDLRLTPSAKRALQMAAEAADPSLSELVLSSALTKIDESLPDRRLFALDTEKWLEFQQARDAPVKPAPRLAKLLESLSDPASRRFATTSPPSG